MWVNYPLDATSIGSHLFLNPPSKRSKYVQSGSYFEDAKNEVCQFWNESNVSFTDYAGDAPMMPQFDNTKKSLQLEMLLSKGCRVSHHPWAAAHQSSFFPNVIMWLVQNFLTA